MRFGPPKHCVPPAIGLQLRTQNGVIAGRRTRIAPMPPKSRAAPIAAVVRLDNFLGSSAKRKSSLLADTAPGPTKDTHQRQRTRLRDWTAHTRPTRRPTTSDCHRPPPTRPSTRHAARTGLGWRPSSGQLGQGRETPVWLCKFRIALLCGLGLRSHPRLGMQIVTQIISRTRQREPARHPIQ